MEIRAILVPGDGGEVKDLTKDHKPNDPEEKKRIVKNGGMVQKTFFLLKNSG